MGADEEGKTGIKAYIALIFAIVFFSGLCKTNQWYGVFDFSTLDGGFGTIVSSVTQNDAGELVVKKSNLRGIGGSGAKDGFLFAFTLVPTVMFALGILNIVEAYGALRAACELLTPLLRPLLGLPGAAGLALIASLQSADSGASITKDLVATGHLTDKEKAIFTMFQFSAGATITNFLSSGAVLFTFANDDGTPVLPATIGLCLAVIFVMKIVGANMFRFYIAIFDKKGA